MRIVRLETLWGAVACVSIWSCASDTLIGENSCYGEHVVCKSDAPTLGASYADPTPGSVFDVVASRSVTPTWIHEFPRGRYLPQVAPAPDGGVWAASVGEPSAELQRIDAEGKLVASYPVASYGFLFVDEELNPRLLGSPVSGQVSSFSVNGRGDVSEHSIDVGSQTVANQTDPNEMRRGLVAPAPDGGVRVGLFRARGSYVAEYGLMGDLLWQQSGTRDARDFAFEDLGVGSVPVVSYGLVPLSDGALAVGVPKYIDNVPGISVGRTQGITLLETDGNVRWDLWLGGKPSFTLLMTAGLDGNVVVADSAVVGDSTIVQLLDRAGGVAARWMGRRAEYHDVTAKSLCSDAAGDIYISLFTGIRDTPVPTVCRMRSSEPNADVVCLAVDGLSVDSNLGSLPMVSIAAPAPGAVVFTFQTYEEDDSGASNMRTRLVRVDF